MQTRIVLCDATITQKTIYIYMIEKRKKERKEIISFFGLKKGAVASFQGCRRMNNLLLLHSAVT